MKKTDDMTDEQLQKKQFVKRYLKGLMRALDESIISIQYKVTDENDEFVLIVRRNANRKMVNITGDSLFAITRDVIGSLCI